MSKQNKRNRDLRRLEQKLSSLSDLPPTIEVSRMEQIAHSGPLPAPETLARYNEMMPGLADRIVTMAEAEAAHRRGLETKLMDARIGDAQSARQIEMRGQDYALTIALTLVMVGLTIVILGHPATGGIVMGTTLVSLVGVFITGRSQKPPAEASKEKAEQSGELAKAEGKK